MADKPKNPKMEFQTNVTEQIRLSRAKPFSSGKSQYGQWYGFEITHGDQTKTLFADERLYAALQGFGDGTELRIQKHEGKKEDGTKFYTWEVHPAIFKENGELAPAPKASIENDEEAYQAYRKKRGSRFQDALLDAVKIVEAINDRILESQNTGHVIDTLKAEDLRALAISMAIDYQRSK